MVKAKKITEHWADVAAKRVIQEKGDKDRYCGAAGITPSGTIHIGNFREIITVDLIARALQNMGKKVRFIYSWDDYDVFRKIPKNMPKQEELKGYLRKPIVDVPDPFDEEKSYARHHEVKVERDVKLVGIFPEYIYQSKKYRASDYANGIKTALQNKEKIRVILDKYRKEPLVKEWLPLRGYCPKCNTDDVVFSDYDEKYSVKIYCNNCSHSEILDLRKTSFVKLPWKVDWPMRWAFEKVDFEPGGKDHSTYGSSFSVGKEIVKLYDWTFPSYQRYDFVIIKGVGGKMSSSSGNVITLGDCLEVYEPAIIRFLFAGTRPTAEFSIAFDIDVLKVYSDFDKLERIYFSNEECSETKLAKYKRDYELSMVDKPSKRMPFQPSFREITNILQVHEGDIDAVVKFYASHLKNKVDDSRVRARSQCAKNWLEKYAPEEFKFSINDEVPEKLDVSKEVREMLKSLGKELNIKRNDEELHSFFYNFVREKGIEPKDAFRGMYLTLIGKEKGPRLASFINSIGNERVAKILSQL